MATNRFDVCVSFVLGHEIEYNRDGSVRCEHDPNDPGGATKYGLDQRSHPHIDICALGLADAKQLYHEDEWLKCRCNDLPEGWDLAVFDAAVNLGKGWAIPHLQTVVGSKADGFIGPKTVAAVNSFAKHKSKLSDYLDAREIYYRALPAQKNGHPFRTRYIKGWLARLNDVRLEVLKG